MAQKVPLSAVARQLNVLADHLLSLEANQAPPESVAAACSGAGRPRLSEEPRPVLGPGEILAKMTAFLKNDYIHNMKPVERSDIEKAVVNRDNETLHYLSDLLGVEASEPPQDAE